MSKAPTLNDTIGNASKEKDIEEQLARLRSTQWMIVKQLITGEYGEDEL